MESKKMKSESVVPGEQKKTEFALGKTNIRLIGMISRTVYTDYNNGQ